MITIGNAKRPQLRLGALLGLLLTGLTSCATISVFTPNVRDQLDSQQLNKVQYYVSSTVTLTRVLPAGEKRSVTSGRVLLVNGQRVDEVVITARTPGVLVGVLYGTLNGSGNHEFFDISFSSSNGQYLRFVKMDNLHKYLLVAYGTKPWPNTLYGNKYYRVTYDSAAVPYLLGYINSKFFQTTNIQRAPGRLVR